MDNNATAILLICLEYDGGGAGKIAQLDRVTPEEWSAVVELAQAHNIAPLLDFRLKNMNVNLPADVRNELREAYRQNTLQMMRSVHEIHRTLRIFQAEEIPVIVLKGAYLAEAVYEQVGLRTMRDIDLLVKKDDLERVEQVLLATGYLPENPNRVIIPENHHFTYHLPGNRYKIEVHWILNQYFSLGEDVAAIWHRAQPVTLAQIPVYTLSPEDLILHLCMHTVIHAYELRVAYEMRLRMLCDLGEIVRHFGLGIDWQVIILRARQWGVVRATYMVLRLAREMLGVSIPEEVINSLRPNGFYEGYYDLARAQITNTPHGHEKGVRMESTYLARLSGAKGIRGKLALIQSRLLLSRQAMAHRYPAPANSWRIYIYYPVRWLELLGDYGMSFWHLVRGDTKTITLAEHTNRILELRDWLISG